MTNENTHGAGFILRDDAYASRETVRIASGKLAAGTPLVRTALAQTGTLSAAPISDSNTGNGIFTADPAAPVTVKAKPGIYTVRAIAVPSANNATFRLEDPDGNFVQDASLSGAGTSAQFTDHIKFSITDGSVDFAVGDGFDITVGYGSGSNQADTYVAASLGGTVDAVLYASADATTGSVAATAIVRDAEVQGDELAFPVGASDAQKRAMCASLLRHDIVVRWSSEPIA